MSNVWRLTNNGGAFTGNGVVGDLAANQAIDLPANLVAIGWNATNGAGSSIDRIYMQNQVTRINTVQNSGNSANAPIMGVGTANNQVGRAQLIEDNGFGKILYDSAG